MNGYLFRAWASCIAVHEQKDKYGNTEKVANKQEGDVSLIVCGENAEVAEKEFLKALLDPCPDGSPNTTEIRKIFAAQIIGEMFTESGDVPIDWGKIDEQMYKDFDEAGADNFEGGFWVDVDQVITTEMAKGDFESLRKNLPEDISSGLNWAKDKQFYFLITALSPPPPLPEFVEEPESASDSMESSEENTARSEARALYDIQKTYSALADMEAVALIRARNSAVAAALWRRYAASTPLAGNRISVGEWCNFIGPESEDEPKENLQ